MKGPVPAEVAYRRIEDALRMINSVPASPGTIAAERALLTARARMKHLEQRLGETETMRDRIAMQLLPSALACHTEQGDRSDSGSIRRAYELADEVLAVRAQGSAGVLGETTSPDFSIREPKVGDTFPFKGSLAEVTGVFAPIGQEKSYVLRFANGGTDSLTLSQIATMQAGYGDAS